MTLESFGFYADCVAISRGFDFYWVCICISFECVNLGFQTICEIIGKLFRHGKWIFNFVLMWGKKFYLYESRAMSLVSKCFLYAYQQNEPLKIEYWFEFENISSQRKHRKWYALVLQFN